MNSRSRIQAALARAPVDRVPIFMWFHPDTAAALGRLLEIPPDTVGEVMGNDVRQAWVSNNFAMEGICHERDGQGHIDEWGIEWVKQGPFNQLRHAPLEQVTRTRALAYEFPHDRADTLLANMHPLLAPDRHWFAGCDISPCLFEMICRLRGMEHAILDLAADPELTESLLSKAERFAVMLARAACDRFDLDWLWTGDDVGGQLGMIMSPSCWRERIAPRLARIVAVGKQHDLPVAYHCCGALRPIIPDLIDMGVDVLNPVQCNCPGMDPLDLKREYGASLTFMGGVDTQALLPRATPAEVRRETERLIDGMTSGGGGYILAASHTVPPETPMDNIFAMYAAAGITREQIFDQAAALRGVISH